ncbi:MAG TPA: DUF4185 domain-containing protein [Polyangiaceae bacterium]|jgi:hypothetical protein
MRRTLVVLVIAACSQTPPAVPDAGTCGLSLASWPEADALFTNDAQWIGADAAYSVDLGGGRVLWLFGDTFVAKDASRSRSNAWFVRNSVAIQTGYDPSKANAKFFWQTTAGNASSFIPENGTHWFWPLSGVRLPTRLVLFFLEEESVSGGLGFQSVGTKVVFVTNPDADPSSWNVVDGDLPAFSFPIAFGAAVLADGPYVYAFGDEEPGDHSVYVARFDASALDAGDASSPLFWTNAAWSPPGASAPDVIFPSASAFENPPTEFSVQKTANGFLAVHSIGFGATQLAVRTSPAPEGPWSVVCNAFTPPESGQPGISVYAAKGHPELTGGSLVATYATNASDLATLASDMNVYFPRFVRSP